MIEELTLQSFKSYSARQTIRFTKGVNKISGRNASGKTTLLEAILFGLFGDVPGVDKQDLVPLGGGDLRVSIRFRSPHTGHGAEIVREGGLGRDGNFRTSTLYLEIEGEAHPYVREKDVQGKIRELLGVSKRVFFNVVYAKQKEFVEILNPPKGRMDATLGLTTPAEVAEELREVRRELENRGRISEKGAIEERMRSASQSVVEAEHDVEEVDARHKELALQAERLRTELGSARRRVDALEGLEASFRHLERRQNELEVIKGRRREREKDMAELNRAVGENTDEVKQDLRAKLKEVETLEDRLRLMVEGGLSRERRELDGEIARLSHQVSEHLDLKRQGIAVCPKCGQKVDYVLLEEDLILWQKQLSDRKVRLADLEGELKQTQEQIRIAQERRLEARHNLSRLEDQLQRIEDIRGSMAQVEFEAGQLSERLEMENMELAVCTESELSTRITSLQEGRRLVDERLRQARETLMHTQANLNGLEASLRETERQRTEIERRLGAQRKILEDSKKALDRIMEYEAKIRALETVQRRYVEYERQLRDNTLRQLEWLTGKYFDRLTDQRAYAGCHIDRDNYVLEVRPIGSDRLMAAWRTGGGHESLLALSERLALLRVMGFPYLLILDEPTDAVDSENIPQLMEYIARSGQEIGQVLLVTHHGHGEEEGVNLIRVRKEDGESRATQEIPQAEVG